MAWPGAVAGAPEIVELVHGLGAMLMRISATLGEIALLLRDGTTMKRTPEDRERLRRLLEENESARRDLQALLDRVEARIRARREERSWVGRVLGHRAASR